MCPGRNKLGLGCGRKKEQTDDGDKKEYCEIQIDHTEDNVKESEHAVEDLKAHIADTEEGIKTLTEEIQALKDGIAALDKAVVEATETRKEENSEYTELMAGDTAAKEERITLNMGGTLAPTAPSAGIAGTGIGLAQGAAKPPLRRRPSGIMSKRARRAPV